MGDITNPQTRTLRGMAATTLPDDDAYRDFLRTSFPEKEWTDPERPSTKDLTKREADRAIKGLKRLQGDGMPEPPERPTPPPGAGRPWEGRYDGHPNKHQAGRLTQDQANEIARLEWQLGWVPEPKRLGRFIKRQLKIQKPVDSLTKREATKVITGLRKILASQ